jgi:hypothetical protein
MAARCCSVLPLLVRVSTVTKTRYLTLPTTVEHLSRSMSQIHGIGSGVERGGGGGGSIRESGGSFGEREAALEEMYFRELSARQLENLSEYYVEEMKHVEKELKASEETLRKQKEKLEHLKDMMKQIM